MLQIFNSNESSEIPICAFSPVRAISDVGTWTDDSKYMFSCSYPRHRYNAV